LCPNPVLISGERLDTVFGNGFALITTKRPLAFESALLEKRGAVVHIAEPGSELAHWLRRGNATAAVVRPDRAVMCAGPSLSAMCAAMPTFHGTPLTQRKESSR
jgi:3-(3-hydroxy-phenyl)propionate hydroxylase